MNARADMFSIYSAAFVQRSHELVVLGYQRLNLGEAHELEETEITGLLCDAMEAVLNGDERPPWATLFTVVDDQPESLHGRLGKRRPRTDVCVRCINPRPSQLFRFEAKRLNGTSALASYLGEDGLLALVTGYYGDVPHAGMLGYVQTDTCPTWKKRIKTRVSTKPRDYHAVEPVLFSELKINAPEPVFVTDHHQKAGGKQRRITHTLLFFGTTIQ